ncbi:response regulator [Glaciecola sp. 1036]|uniref:response regulator n=1 Tax=Alteromonadaceae TaxID=72275 RepID=UPI003CFFCD37
MESIKRILIADDDEDDVFIIQDRLSQLMVTDGDFTVETDFSAIVEKLSNNHYDLCLLDFFLGSFTGIDVLVALEEKQVSTPIILLTGQSDDDIAKKVIRKGAQDYIPKAAIDSPTFEKSISYAVSRKALEFSRIRNQQIESENLAKDRFISHLSHELRTPLTSILGYADLLLENPITAPVNKELKIIQKNGRHLLSLLNDVLDLSKLLADKFELHRQPCDLRQMLVDIYGLLTVAAADKGINLVFESKQPVDNRPLLDETRCKQVLLNILGNAIKFTDQGEVRLTLQQHGETEPRLSIDIQDSGIGIAENKLDEIFKPFSQLEDVSKRKSGGAGLGLSISAEIIQRMNGSLTATSEIGKGTCFHIDVPIQITPESIKEVFDFSTEQYTKKSQHVPSLNGKVLVVDDIFEIRQLVGQLVKNTGAEVEFAKNGRRAIELLEGYKYDLVLMDLQMPGMTGQETIQNIQQAGIECKVLAMTAGSTFSIQDELISLGFNGLITKPIDSEIFYRVLTKYLTVQSQNEQVKALPNSMLLIEDDEDAAMIMKMLLTQLGYQVSVAHSATDAYKNLQKHADGELTVVSDLNLPDGGGAALLSAIRQHHPHSPLFVISGEQPNLQYSTEYNIAEFIVKPVTKDKLAEVFSQ